jgi:hypothetical protein
MEKSFFAISAWLNPYRKGDAEHFIVGPFDTSAKARKSAQRRLENGQPQSFTDWCKGTIKIAEHDKVVAVLTKMKLQAPESIADETFDYEPCMWRL